MCQPQTQPNKQPRNKENHQDSSKDTKTVPRDGTAFLAIITHIQERVRVKSLSLARDVCDAEI